MKYELYVPNISCNHCKMRITKALQEIGLSDFEISVEDKRIVLEAVDIKPILEKLEEIDYPVESYREIAR